MNFAQTDSVRSVLTIEHFILQYHNTNEGVSQKSLKFIIYFCFFRNRNKRQKVEIAVQNRKKNKKKKMISLKIKMTEEEQICLSFVKRFSTTVFFLSEQNSKPFENLSDFWK